DESSCLRLPRIQDFWSLLASSLLRETHFETIFENTTHHYPLPLWAFLPILILQMHEEEYTHTGYREQLCMRLVRCEPVRARNRPLDRSIFTTQTTKLLAVKKSFLVFSKTFGYERFKQS
ncbi:hypothetical protein BGZ97_011429, partial [Linnemannia gamsii]